MQALYAALASVGQQYLLQARQMQALSLAVHIPLVCFGIAFPALVLFCEWRSLRTDDTAGAVVLLPSLTLLFHLFLRGHLVPAAAPAAAGPAASHVGDTRPPPALALVAG